MNIASFPFQTLGWGSIKKEEHKGIAGYATWQIFMMNDIRIRLVEYSAGYVADHWCSRGHIMYCIEGEMQTTLQDGRIFQLLAGMTYHVGDNSDAHQSQSKNGCKLFIVD